MKLYPYRGLFAVGLLIGGYASATAEPSIEVVDGTFNFGKTVQAATMNHTFWIRGTGDAPVRITLVDPGCGCTKMPLVDSLIAPGDSIPLTIIFDTKHYRGNITKRPRFVTDINDDSYFVKIFAEALTQPHLAEPIAINPPRVDISQFSEKPRRTAFFDIVNKSEQELHVEQVGNGFHSFTLDLPATIGPKTIERATITLKDDALEAEFDESVTLEFDDDFATRHTIPIRRIVKLPGDSTESTAH